MRSTSLSPGSRFVRPPRGIGALLAATLLAAACTDHGIVSPPSVAEVTVEGAPAVGVAGGPTEPHGPRVAVGPITNGANHTGSIVAAGQTDVWTFTANTGQYIVGSIGETGGTVDFTPWIRVTAPNGSLIVNTWNSAAANFGIAAPQTGTYTVQIATADAGNDATGTYTFSVAALPGALTVSGGDQGGPMTVGVNHAGTQTVGDQDIWTFNANTGDAIILAIGEVTGSVDYTPWIRLIAPNGALVGNSWNTAAAQIAVNATQTGTYTVVVNTADSGNDATGDYRLVLALSSGVPTVPAGDEGGDMTNGVTHTGTLTVGDLDQWQFSAAVGDAIILSVGEQSGTNFTPWIRLLAPNGAVVGNSWNTNAAQIQVTAAVAGTYSVVVSTANSGNDGTGDYTLVLARAPAAITVSPGDEGGALTNGANATGSLFVGDLDVYTFSSNAGIPMAISIGETAGTNFTPWIRLIAPNGAQVGNSWNTTVAQINLIASQTGTYTLIVSTANSGNDGTGNYTLTLQKGGAFVTSPGDEGGAITVGTNVSGILSIGDLDRFTFTANQGDYIAASVGEVTGTNFTPWIRLVSPTGQVIGNAWNTTVAQVNVAAPVTGTYTIAIGTANSGNDGTGTYVLTVARAPGSFTVSPGDDGGAITNGTKNGTITIGDLDMYSFSGNLGANLKVTIAPVTGTLTTWIRLIAPNGALIGNVWNAAGATINILSAPQSGTYTIIVGTANSGNDATGTYSLTLSGANLAPNPGDAPKPIAAGPLPVW
ncbi:MAG: pre-peptidase C-terminal domain-containing protein [Gemmatimonadaceae bacterium]